MTSLVEYLTNLLRELKIWIIVQPWERAVRVRGGKDATLWEPGWYFRIPFFDDVQVVNNRLRVSQVPSVTVETKDRRPVTASAIIGFRISDPLTAALTMKQPEYSCAAFGQAVIATYLTRERYDLVSIAELEARGLDAMVAFAPGLSFEFFRVIDFAAVRTLRLLQSQDAWRPYTTPDAHDRGWS